MRSRFESTIVLLLVTLAIAGCQRPAVGPATGEPLITGQNTIGIYQFAALLGLRVAESASTHITLKNSTNTVMLFTHTGGRVYVNTKPIGPTSGIEKINGQIYVSKSLVPKIRSAMVAAAPYVAASKLSGRVVIDAGHGGKDPGAISCLGYYEKTINLQVARKVASLLGKKGLKVVMTRDSDRFLELEERAAIANRQKADLFVSIHSDSNPDSSRRGFTIFIARWASRSSNKAAQALTGAMSRTGSQSHGIRRANYRVLVQTKGPSVLVELGHLSNYRDASLLRNDSFQNLLAQAVANGVTGFFAAR